MKVPSPFDSPLRCQTLVFDKDRLQGPLPMPNVYHADSPEMMIGHAGTLRCDPFAPPTPSQAFQERPSMASDWSSQVSGAEWRSNSLHAPEQSASRRSITAMPSTAVNSDGTKEVGHWHERCERLPEPCSAEHEASQASGPLPDQKRAMQAHQNVTPCKLLSGPAKTLEGAITLGRKQASIPALSVQEHPVKRLGPMQAAKLALARKAADRIAIQVIPRKRSHPLSQAGLSGGAIAKRAKAAAMVQQDSQEAGSMQQWQPQVPAPGTADSQQQSTPVSPKAGSSSSGHALHVTARSKIIAGAVCAKCEKPVPAGTVSSAVAWACTGACCQTFHFECAPPPALLSCFACVSGMRVCFFCKQLTRAALLIKCTGANCGRFFHSQCAAR